MLDRKQKLIKKIKSGRCIIDCHTHVGISFKSYVQSAFPYCLSFEDLILRMKYNSIDYSVVFPLDSTYYDVSEENPKNIQETERYSKFPYELENKNLLKEIFEIFPEYCGKVLPFLMFDPGRRTREQAALFEELSRKYPVFGLKTCTTYIQSYIKDLETTGRPILDFAINSRMPVIIHSSYDRGDPWAKIEDILEIAEKYPQLKICLAHSARFLKSALIKAAALKKIDSVLLTTRKPKEGLRGALYIKEKGMDIDSFEKETVIFEGSALEAIKAFPKNVNVSSALSLAGIGAKKTKVRIICDPGIKRNIHEIKVEGDSGKIFIRMENFPSPDNPKTSYQAALSAMAVIKGIADNVKIGT